MTNCADCGGEITVADNANGGLISINVDGHARAAHRVCPEDFAYDYKADPPWYHGLDYLWDMRD